MATLGIDIGCISVKMALVGLRTRRPCLTHWHGVGMAYTRDCSSTRRPPGSQPSSGTPPLLVTRYRRIKGNRLKPHWNC